MARITRAVTVGRTPEPSGAVPNGDVAAVAGLHPDRIFPTASIEVTNRNKAMHRIDAARFPVMCVVVIEPGAATHPGCAAWPPEVRP